MTIVMPLFLLFVLGILLLLCVEMWALLNPTSRRLALGVVSLAMGCGAHISGRNDTLIDFTTASDVRLYIRFVRFYQNLCYEDAILCVSALAATILVMLIIIMMPNFNFMYCYIKLISWRFTA